MYNLHLLFFQEQLNEIKKVWNTHRIRPSRNPSVPSGIPNIMFSAPHLWGADDHLVHVNASDLATAKQTCKFLSTIPCDEDIFDLCTITMEESGLDLTTHQRHWIYTCHWGMLSVPNFLSSVLCCVSMWQCTSPYPTMSIEGGVDTGVPLSQIIPCLESFK